MKSLRQTATLTLSALRTVPQRMGASLVTVMGIMSVVAVLASLLAMSEGAHLWSARNVRADRAVVLSKGALSPPTSVLSREAIATIANAPGVKKDAQGKPMITAGSMVSVDVMNSKGEPDNVFLIGITNLSLYPELHLLSGRVPRPGLHELMASKAAQVMYRGLRVGEHLPLRGVDWTVVGVFEDTGGVFDQVLFSDAETVLSAFGRNAFQQATVVLDSPAAYGTFKQALLHDPTLAVDVYTEAESRESAVSGVRGLLDFVSYFVGGLMAIGAICAAISSLHAAVDTRQREIATLRAIGFGRMPIIVSVLAEGLLLGLCAALIGAFIAWSFFNGKVISTQSLTFPLAVSGHLLIVSIVWALAMALIGGLAPALRAARLPVATALRAN